MNKEVEKYSHDILNLRRMAKIVYMMCLNGKPTITSDDGACVISLEFNKDGDFNSKKYRRNRFKTFTKSPNQDAFNIIYTECKTISVMTDSEIYDEYIKPLKDEKGGNNPIWSFHWVRIFVGYNNSWANRFTTAFELLELFHGNRNEATDAYEHYYEISLLHKDSYIDLFLDMFNNKDVVNSFPTLKWYFGDCNDNKLEYLDDFNYISGTVYLCVKNRGRGFRRKDGYFPYLKPHNLIAYQKSYINKRRNAIQLVKFVKKFPEYSLLTNSKKLQGTVYLNYGFERAFDLAGDARNICGYADGICGNIHPELYGDVSEIKGDITNLYGLATGVKLIIKNRLDKPTDIETLINPVDTDVIDKTIPLLSNDENQTMMQVWRTLCYHTIGLKDDEYALFDKPEKLRPPFPVDKWGRYYIGIGQGKMLVFSINPADISFAKDVNRCSTCFCWNSGTDHWQAGMRCLIALNSVNRTLGVWFVIDKNSKKKMNQFEGIKFKWYEPLQAGFFQYTSKTAFLWDYYSIPNRDEISFIDREYNISEEDRKTIEPIYGHDGYNVGHDRQKELAYLETFIKETYRWAKKNFVEDGTAPLTNNSGYVPQCDYKLGWVEQMHTANLMAEELKTQLGKQKDK